MTVLRRRARAALTAAVLGGLLAPLGATSAWAADAATDPTARATEVAEQGAEQTPAAETPTTETTAAPRSTATRAPDPAPSSSPSVSDAETSIAADDARVLRVTAQAEAGATDAATVAEGAIAVSGAIFDWGVNNETNGGAYFGGCNFLSAGVAGDTGSARLWQQTDGLFRSADGNTTIVKPTPDGAGLTQPSWATKCSTPSGTSVNGLTTSAPDSYTQSRVQIAKGSGTIDPGANTAEISWTGSFTVAYYGGMTYWSVTDPKLTVDASGTGVVTATLSGYGTDMDDTSIWAPLEPREATLATLSGVDVTDTGLTVTPDFLGVTVPDDISGRNAYDGDQPWSGAFPEDFLRFQVETGQSSYWYTTAGAEGSIQPRKQTLPLSVVLDAEGPAPAAPAIVMQPQSASVAAGATASFVVEAAGVPAPTYQWQRLDRSGDWVDIPGGTAAKLDVAAAADLNGTTYRVVVRNESGTVTSGDVVLTVTSGGVDPVDPEPPTEPVETSGALFDWGINNETNGGAYFGGCNFLSAGVAGDAGSSRLWTAGDGFFRSQVGNTTIVRPAATGSGVTPVTWDTKCKTPDGATVNGNTTNAADSYTQTRVQIAGGTGTLDPETNTADIQWDGSFTVAYYGGMTYWSASDPRLVVAPDGTGTITVTASGYGADMDDSSIWRALESRQMTLATLSGVRVTDAGITVTPDFLGVTVPADISGRNPYVGGQPWSGAFPDDFLRFQIETGQSSYWYTTAGGPNSIQPRKTTLPLRVTMVRGQPTQTPPTITTQPQDVSAKAGTPASFAVDAIGVPAPTYQWQRRDRGGAWADVAGATHSTLRVLAAEVADRSAYRVRVTNPVGSVTSAAAILTVTTAGAGPGTPGAPTGPVETAGALFDWGINNETNGGAYFGGCNFLSAGVAGDAGSARLWTAGDGYFRSQDGNTTIVRPTSDGSGLGAVTWDTKCQNPDGASVNGKTTAAADSYTQTRVRISGGTGTLDPATNTAKISWSGSFTVAYYGGMTYWSASDPRLVVRPDGTGTVTVTASGYGADMDDTSKWNRLAPRDVVIANLSGVRVTDKGITVTPDYLGVSVPSDVGGRNAQTPRTADNAAWWGAFPEDFLRFQMETGQSSYWWTTPGSRSSIQPRKVTLPLTVCPTSECTAPRQDGADGPATIDLSQNALKPPLGKLRPASQASAAAAEETVVMMRKASAIAQTALDPTAQTRLVVAAVALIIALGLLTLVAAAGGGVFALGVLGGAPPGGRPPRT